MKYFLILSIIGIIGFTGSVFAISENEITMDAITILSNDVNSMNPEMAEIDGTLYVAWHSEAEKKTSNGDREKVQSVLMVKSDDGGKTFSSRETLGQKNEWGSSQLHLIPAGDKKLYALWDIRPNVVAEVEHDTGNTKDNPDIICNTIPWDEVINLCNKITSENIKLAIHGNMIYRIWEERTPDHTADLFFDVSSNYGATFSDPSKITVYDKTHLEPNGYPTITDYTIAAWGENVYIYWSDYDVNLQKRLLLLSSFDAGQSFGESVIVESHDANSTSGFDDIEALARSNELYLVWRAKVADSSNFAIFMQKMVDGKIFGEKTTVSDPAKSSDEPSVILSGNDLHFAWQDHAHSEPDIIYRTSPDGGNTFGNMINLSNTKEESRTPAVLEHRTNVYVLWDEDDWPASNGQIHLSVSSNHGQNFSEPTPISESYWNSRNVDAVVSDFPNTIHTAWIDSEDGNTSDVFFRTVSLEPAVGYVELSDDQPHKQPLKLDDFASKIWYEHEFIVDGTILDIRGYGEKERTYDIQINSFFKPTDNADTKLITVYGSPNFYNIEGDRGIFFIKKENARWVFGEYDAKATPECPPELMFVSPKLIDPPLYRGGYGPDFSNVDCAPHYYKKYLPEYMKFHGATVPSPLIQQTVGISSSEVVCNEGLELVLKNNERAACVKPETVEKLIERGWTKDDNSMLQKVLDLCGCQESGGPCINPIFKWQNKTHHIDSVDCKWIEIENEN